MNLYATAMLIFSVLGGVHEYREHRKLFPAFHVAFLILCWAAMASQGLYKMFNLSP